MEFFTTNFAPIMFVGLIMFLLLGFPVAFSSGPAACFSVLSALGWGSFLPP